MDDFGRQRVPASELLNRWIVPLESRVDFLALHTGRKFQVPFDVLVIFATNLEPRKLADEAFLRRIPYKVHATNPSLDQFSAIFFMVCKKHGITFDQAVVDHLCTEYYEGRGLEMRACHPRDLVEHMVNPVSVSQAAARDHAAAPRRGLPHLLPRQATDRNAGGSLTAARRRSVRGGAPGRRAAARDSAGSARLGLPRQLHVGQRLEVELLRELSRRGTRAVRRSIGPDQERRDA